VTRDPQNPAAKRLVRWVCHEVLPQIRKTGSYHGSPGHLSALLAAIGIPLPPDAALPPDNEVMHVTASEFGSESLAGRKDFAASVEPVAAATNCEDGLKAAIKAAGGTEALARALGINPSAVAQWERVPAERIVQIERLANVPRNVLRPDLYPQPKDD